MRFISLSSAYCDQVADLVRNPEQLTAYDSTKHCVVLAGPGSGKTNILVLKLARILTEAVRAPRGVACITYSQECARELNRRLESLGLKQVQNLFVGTVHGFCLRHLLLPYARLAGLPIPFPIKIATEHDRDRLLEKSKNSLFCPQYHISQVDLDRHRRSILDRSSAAWQNEEDLSSWSEAYERLLHNEGLIDYDDMVIYGHQLIAGHDWVLPLIQAKFPVIAVDEYQDLGVALHRIITRLAFVGGVRLFAVGDPDQSIYGFTGADGRLLDELAARNDIEKVQLLINYRSGEKIVKSSQLIINKDRRYSASDPNRQASIKFVQCPNGLKGQALYAIEEIIPAALGAKATRGLSDIAILYKNVRSGNIVAETVKSAGYNYIRVDNSAPYRKVALTSWIEDCAAWCAGGWRKARPRLRSLIDRYLAFQPACLDEKQAAHKGQVLTELLWSLRESAFPAREFVTQLRTVLLDDLINENTTFTDQKEQLDRMEHALSEGGELASLDIASLGGNSSSMKLNLLTLHSAKGCEYDVVIIVGLDYGDFPWRNENQEKLLESRRLFYVGLTRARDEVYLLYSGFIDTRYGRKCFGRSPFIDELYGRMKTVGLAR